MAESMGDIADAIESITQSASRALQVEKGKRACVEKQVKIKCAETQRLSVEMNARLTKANRCADRYKTLLQNSKDDLLQSKDELNKSHERQNRQCERIDFLENDKMDKQRRIKALERKVRAKENKVGLLKELALKDKLHDCENQFLQAASTLGSSETRAENLARKNETLRLKLEQAVFQNKLKAKTLEQCQEKLLQAEKELSEQTTINKENAKRNGVLRQRCAVYKERIRSIEGSVVPELIKESYEKQIKDMELSFLKKERVRAAQVHKDRLEFEEKVSRQYKEISEVAVANAQHLMDKERTRSRDHVSRLEQKIRELQGSTILITKHKELLDQAKGITDEARQLLREKEHDLQRSREEQQSLQASLEQLNRTLHASQVESQRRSAERAASVNLLQERLHDEEQRTKDVLAQNHELQLQKKSLEQEIAHMSKERGSLQASQVLVSSQVEKAERAEQMHRAERLRAEQTFQVRLAETKQKLVDAQRTNTQMKQEAEAQVEELQTQLRVLSRQYETLVGKHSDLVRTMQKMLPRAQDAQFNQEQAQEVAAQLDEDLQSTFAERQELRSVLEREQSAHAICREELAHAKEQVKQLLAAKATLASALQVARESYGDGDRATKRKLKQLSQKYENKLREKVAYYVSIVDRLSEKVHVFLQRKGKESSTPFFAQEVMSSEDLDASESGGDTDAYKLPWSKKAFENLTSIKQKVAQLQEETKV